MTGPFHGSCLCGAVRFEVDAFQPHVAHCHCSMCRKFHGAACATFAGVLRHQFRWAAGEAALKRYTAPNGTTRTFCRHCGSSLMFASPHASADTLEIALGAMDDDLPVKPDTHIFVGSKANWDVLTDCLPRFDQGRDSAAIKVP